MMERVEHCEHHCLRLTPYILIALMGLALLGCQQRPPDRVLFDFESDEELDRFNWRCHTLFSLTGEHATHGTKALRLELYPPDYPGIAPRLDDNDWRPYNALSFDIHNPEDKVLQLAVRIDDRKDYPDHGDRYNKIFLIQPGWNRITIPFDTLVTSESDRELDLSKIWRLLIFMVHPAQRVVLHVDYLRLEG